MNAMCEYNLTYSHRNSLLSLMYSAVNAGGIRGGEAEARYGV